MLNQLDVRPSAPLHLQQGQGALYAQIAERSARLTQLAAELKTELFGIDEVIDRVIESLRAWYVLPDIINRPVIICLWGLTGTGKTQLTRSIAQKLGFYNRFVEVQMDGFSNDAIYQSSAISDMLSGSGIEEGEPGILALDEFQHFRTLKSNGDEVNVAGYQDMWTLLSDGRLAPSLSFIAIIEDTLADSLYHQNRSKFMDNETGKTARFFNIAPHDARKLKACLKLKEPLLEIMGWTMAQIQTRLDIFRTQLSAWEADYSKLLIFVSGNLDEMYAETAKRVEDCDTDADIFHALTKKLSLIDVKKALGERFKPEQIARLGNNHVIYPSFSRATYQKLIANTCERYVRDIAQSSQLQFVIDAAVLTEIYNNAVFPAQGTRPLFSSIHAILSAPLVNATLWAIEHGATPKDRINVTLDSAKKHLVVHLNAHVIAYPVAFELNELKQCVDLDFRILLAVHESGHGLIYGLLFRQPPQELKINAASFDGGYASYAALRAESRQSCRDMICVALGGRAAEVMVFGHDASTTSAATDYKKATASAARFVRQYGFGNRFSRTDVGQFPNQNHNTDIEATNTAIEALLAEQYARAGQLLQAHSAIFMRITQALVQHGEVTRQSFADWLGLQNVHGHSALAPYADRLATFESQLKLRDKLVASSLSSEVETL